MAVLLAFPILGILLIIQSAVVSRIPLLHGTADLVLLALIAWSLHKRVKTAWHWAIIGGLMVSLVSALPLATPLIGYLLTITLALLLRQRVWQAPILAMFITVFFGTLITHGVELAALRVTGDTLPWLTALNLFTLPSVLLNLIFAVPAYALLSDLANWLYPEELEV